MLLSLKTKAANHTAVSIEAALFYLLLEITCSHHPQMILKCTAKETLPEVLCDFQQSHRTTDLIFAVMQVQEICIEQHMDFFAVSINLTKAFYTVRREALWVILVKLGCPRTSVNITRHIFVKA